MHEMRRCLCARVDMHARARLGSLKRLLIGLFLARRSLAVRRQKLEMRLPLCYSHGEHSLTMEVLSQLVGKDSSAFRSADLKRPVVNIALAEKPTSRLQAQLLAVWFGNQISCLANRGSARAHDIYRRFCPLCL